MVGEFVRSSDHHTGIVVDKINSFKYRIYWFDIGDREYRPIDVREFVKLFKEWEAKQWWEHW
jgi:hypothetical protein